MHSPFFNLLLNYYLLMELTEDLKKLLESQGFFYIREIPGQGICALYRLIYTIGLCYGIREYEHFPGTHNYDGRYCYKELAEAKISIISWNGIDDPPGNWIKHKGNRGEYQNPAYQEYD
jgi:hypothetical protein